ncbi:MAG: aldehyde dehydrogenase family protein [Terrimicrobiaceae bacterium]|nr:aldehyde dehydrogenase family protein [Terrimicrobiaceae bacterium]
MPKDPASWRNRSPGDLDNEFPETFTADVETSVRRSQKAFPEWRFLALDERRVALEECRARLQARSEDLALLMASETGKPLREARMELGAVVAKFDLTFADAERWARDEMVTDGPHPAGIRHRPRGPSAVVAPFNFPIHLGHGAAIAYLLAGNAVLFKPSPLAVNVAQAYAAEMQAALPAGVFELVPGRGETGRELCLHPGVRSVCFTGSVPVGTALARELASDYSKSLALELGGKNSAVVCEGADLDAAAPAIADGMCLTSGQRCNATSRVLVHERVAAAFVERLRASLSRYEPGDPLDAATTLGPLVSEAARERYLELTSLPGGKWVLPGGCVGTLSCGKRGYYVRPAVLLAGAEIDPTPLARAETFAPVLVVETFADEEEAIRRHEAWAFGLTASIFTHDESTFQRIGDHLSVGNLYWNLPTTFSPSTLPFGGWGASGNGHPGGRGFIRFATDEQSVQWKT